MPKQTRKSLVQLVHGYTNDGADLIALLHEIATGGLKNEHGDIFEESTIRERLQAIDKLLDRGWGKPIQAIEASGPDNAPIVFTVDLGQPPPARYGEETSSTDDGIAGTD